MVVWNLTFEPQSYTGLPRWLSRCLSDVLYWAVPVLLRHAGPLGGLKLDLRASEVRTPLRVCKACYQRPLSPGGVVACSSMYWAAPVAEPLLVRRSLLGCPSAAAPVRMSGEMCPRSTADTSRSPAVWRARAR